MTAARPLPCSCTRAATLIEGAAQSHELDAQHLERDGAGKPQGPLNAAEHRATAAALRIVARDLEGR